jgi:hypothetical protein
MKYARYTSLTLSLLIPASAMADTSTVIASVSESISGSDSKSYQQIVHLSDGHYTLGLKMIGDALGETFAYTQLFEVIAKTGSSTDLFLRIAKPSSIGGLPFAQLLNFDVVDGASKYYVWSYSISTDGAASASYTTSISKITAVPGPEAGAGLGALAMLAVAYFARRQRNEPAI